MSNIKEFQARLIGALCISAASMTAAQAGPNPQNHPPKSGGNGAAPAYVTDYAIIDNGVIQLGINDSADLNVPTSTPSSSGVLYAGLRYLPNVAEATAAGCLCEGWGVADLNRGLSGYSNQAQGGATNLVVQSFTKTASSATSVVIVNDADGVGLFRVTHAYSPSAATSNLYQVDVTIENISTAETKVRYRRNMDWDIEPTAFSEYVTIYTGKADAVEATTDNGFESSNPLVSPPSDLGYTGQFVDAGPADHGALFDFKFGKLASGASVSFRIFYGGAENETVALDALTAVGAEVYSLGQPSSSDPAVGTPNTFIFAFKGVGGNAVQTTEYVATCQVSDLNGNGYADIAGLKTSNDGVQLVFRDPAAGGKAGSTINVFNGKYTPIDMSCSGDSVYVMVRDTETRATYVKGIDARSGAVLAGTKSKISFP